MKYILLFCGDATGVLKLKPLLVYHSENLQVFKKHKKETRCDVESKQQSLGHEAIFHQVYKGLDGDLLEEFSFITIRFLPLVTILTQVMDQQVISNFKKLYSRKYFNILHCFNFTDKARNCDSRNFECFEADSKPANTEGTVVQDIISLGKFRGLEISAADFELGKYREELRTEKLQE
ncbi:hypothetical protein E2320_001703 [Naja naja]|nr:hypothetical protein E2320_001703 [Naja naja]